MIDRDYGNLEIFLEERILDAHPDYDYENENNTKIAQMGIDRLFKHGLKEGNHFIDIGCGNGRDLIYAKSKGLDVCGLNFLEIDALKCKDREIPIYIQDQSFMHFGNETFDCVFSRHCLEHSVFPYFTLVEYNRVLKDKGLCYVELPAPNTMMGQHETNPNHYAVMGRKMWTELMERSGFEIIETFDYDFDSDDTEGINHVIDTYYVYYLRKITKPHAGWFRDKNI